MYASYDGKEGDVKRFEKVFEPLRYSSHLYENELITREEFAGFINGRWPEEQILIVSVVPTSLRAKCIRNVSYHIADYVPFGMGPDDLKQRISELQLPEAIAAEIFLKVKKMKFITIEDLIAHGVNNGHNIHHEQVLAALGHVQHGHHHHHEVNDGQNVHNDHGHHEDEVNDDHNVQGVVNDGEAQNYQDNNLQ